MLFALVHVRMRSVIQEEEQSRGWRCVARVLQPCGEGPKLLADQEACLCRLAARGCDSCAYRRQPGGHFPCCVVSSLESPTIRHRAFWRVNGVDVHRPACSSGRACSSTRLVGVCMVGLSERRSRCVMCSRFVASARATRTQTHAHASTWWCCRHTLSCCTCRPPGRRVTQLPAHAPGLAACDLPPCAPAAAKQQAPAGVCS